MARIASLLVALVTSVTSHAAALDLVPGPYVYIAAGPFEPDRGGALRNRDGDGAFSLGVGKGFARWLSWEAHFTYFGQDVDTPDAFRGGLFVRTDPRADIETYGFAGQLRFSPTLWRLEPYGAIGLGWYRSQMEVRRSSFLTWYALGDASVKRSDIGVGTHLLLGVDLRLGKSWAVGYQQRSLDLEATFGNEVPGSVDVGGKFRFITARWTF